MTRMILVMVTVGPFMRSLAIGWTCEDGDAVIYAGRDAPVEEVGEPKFFFSYKTPLHAIGAGWSLLAPPRQDRDVWEWWFQK